MKILHPLVVAISAFCVVDPLCAQSGADASEAAAHANKVNLDLPPAFQANIQRDKDGRTQVLPNVFIFKIDAGKLVFADNPQGARFEALDMNAIKFMSLELPVDMQEAFASYDNGKYAEALPQLQSVVKRYQPLRSLKGSNVERAEILMIDCLRRTKKTAELKDALAVAKPENYGTWGKEYLVAFAAWDGYAAKDWKRIEALTRDIDTVPPGTPAAELAFLRAESLKNLERKEDALAEYHRAMAMDFTRSRDIFGDAAIQALEIYNTLPPIKDFFDRYGSPDYNPEAAYVVTAKEAALVAHLVRVLKPAGRVLPTALTKFTKAYDDLNKESKDKKSAAATDKKEE